jgi:hypothetical protein
MKTFGFFMILSLASILITFNIFKNASTDEIVKFILAQQLAFIMYKLIKEENKS